MSLDTLTGKDKLNYFLSLKSDFVKNNVEIVTPESLNTNQLIHITKNNDVKEFIPNVSKRTLGSEDNTVPRICVTDSLWNSMMGYSSDLYEFFNLKEKPKETNDFYSSYLGGYSIYGLNFDFALKPNKKLVPDCEKTNEIWIVNYDPEIKQIPFKKLGNLFYREMSFRSVKEGLIVKVNFFIEVLENNIIKFIGNNLNNSVNLKSGYFSIEVDNIHWKGDHYVRGHNTNEFIIKEITKNEYLIKKKVSASMLSFKKTKPNYFNW